MDRTIISADNGVSAYWTILHSNDDVDYFKIPTKSQRNYQKTKERNITRVDVKQLQLTLCSNIHKYQPEIPIEVILERPMVNLSRFQASMSAMRALEATLIALEQIDVPPPIFIDSKSWQSIMLPNIEGSDELKKASLELGKKLYPKIKFKKDADSLLMALWYRDYAKPDKKS